MLPLLLLTEALPQDVELADRNIRVGDVAVVQDGERTVIGQLPDRTASVVLDEASIERLLRNRFPGRAFELRFKNRVRLWTTAQAARTGACLSAAVDIPVGEFITRDNTARIACDAATPAGTLGYSASMRAPFARAFIAAGTALGPLRLNDKKIIGEGKKMTLRFVSGPVAVERDVVTLQPGEPGTAVFAVTPEGDVVTAKLVLDEKAGAR